MVNNLNKQLQQHNYAITATSSEQAESVDVPGVGLIEADPGDVLGPPLGVDEVSADPLPLLQGAWPGGVTGVEEGLGVHVRAGGQLTDGGRRDVNTAAVRQAVLVHGVSGKQNRSILKRGNLS